MKRFSIVLACVMMAGSAWPATLVREQAATIYALAWTGLGRSVESLPQVAPTVRFVSQQVLRDMACSGQPCPVRGLQRELVVFLDETLDFANAQDASVLLHEFVHVLQWHQLGESKDCQEWVRREREAYGIQAYVLERAGFAANHLRVAAQAMRCL